MILTNQQITDRDNKYLKEREEQEKREDAERKAIIKKYIPQKKLNNFD